MTFALRANESFIELYKVLKVQGMVDGGGEAKHVIGEGLVSVNGVIETRKRNKIVEGDVISFNGESVQVIAAE